MTDRILSDRVRERRLALDLTQGEVAKLVGGTCTQQNINQLENNHTGGIMPRYAIRLPAALQTTMEYLTGKTDNPSPPSDGAVKSLFRNVANDASSRAPSASGQEGASGMLTEIASMLGQMEGRMEARAEIRFKTINEKLDDHERRLAALEEPQGHPHKGRKR